MNKIRITIVTAFGFAGLGLLLWATAPSGQVVNAAEIALSPRPEPDPAVGREAYRDSCARCHGETGAGDGWDAAKMFPRPRNLAEGIFKFRTTESGTPPTDEDLFHTITHGLPGSRMPDFSRLPEELRWQLVYYVKSLSPVFESDQPVPIDLGSDPGPGRADLAKGKAVYEMLQCAACHGVEGRADGPSAPTLVDNWGNPIRAANLTQGWTYRSGAEAKDIVARLLTGLDGTPMPSYNGAVPVEDAWQLAHYIRSLQVQAEFSDRIRAARTDGPLPADPADPAWGKAPQARVLLSANLYKEREVLPVSVTSVGIQALYNGSEVALRLNWDDPDNSTDPVPDAAAVAFMPDRRMKWELGSLRAWPPAPDAPKLDWLRWQSREQSSAVHAAGQWAVVLKRPLAGSGENGAQIGRDAGGRPTLIGVMVWNGGNGETGRHRSNSIWLDLSLD